MNISPLSDAFMCFQFPGIPNFNKVNHYHRKKYRPNNSWYGTVTKQFDLCRDIPVVGNGVKPAASTSVVVSRQAGLNRAFYNLLSHILRINPRYHLSRLNIPEALPLCV